MNIAVAFLTYKPHKTTKSMVDLVNIFTNYKSYLIVDDNSISYPHFQLDDNKCAPYINSSVYKGITSLQKNPNSWDKMFYLFLKETDYDFVWVFEDDVFIPSVDTIVNLNEKYKDCDLVVPNNFKKTDSIKDWHWSYLLDKYEPPFYHSMVCAFGMSRKMMNCLRDFVNKNNTLYYHEVMLNTIAMQNNLKLVDAFELKSVVWQGHWGIDEFLLLPNNVFHPVKDLDTYDNLRMQIQEAKNSNYVPKNNLPEFLKNKIKNNYK